MFRGALLLAAEYPRWGDFRARVQLQAPSQLVLGEDLVVAYTYMHADDPIRAHTAADRLGLYFIGPDGDEPSVMSPSKRGARRPVQLTWSTPLMKVSMDCSPMS